MNKFFFGRLSATGRIFALAGLLTANCHLATFSFSQSCSSWSATHQSDIASTCNQMVMTMMHDDLSRPYLYVANKEAGLKIYDISAIATPSMVATVPTTSFGSLDVMNVSQNGNYLYLALGNTFAASKTGMAIVDVTNPVSPALTDYWELPSSTGGAGIVKAEGNYAYLGAMGHGLVVLDITNKSNITFVSQFIPDINWPVNNPNASLYNARGMEVKNSIVYLCYDAGGIRVINCTNKSAPKETGRWCNPAMYTPLNHPKAYNNIVLNDTLAYVAVDYAGMEVLNIKDTGNITLTGWWNPYNSPNNNWFTSPSHANEIVFDGNCQRVFLSTGKSDMVAIDVSVASNPDSCNYYGGIANGIGTWGIAFHAPTNQLFLSYICTLGIPFASNWTGVKLLQIGSCAPWSVGETEKEKLTVFPVPAKDIISIQCEETFNNSEITICDLLGRSYSHTSVIEHGKTEVNVSALSSGVYFLKLNIDGQEVMKKFVK